MKNNIIYKQAALIAACLFFNLSTTQAKWISKLPPRPRLMLSSENRDLLAQKIEHPDFDKVRIAYYEQLNRNYTPGEVLKRADQRPDEKIRQTIEALAFDYIVSNNLNTASARKAIELSIAYLKTIHDTKGYWENVHTYEALLGCSLVYDWCYGLLKEEEKSILRNEMMRVCSLCEYSYPDRIKKDYFSGHYGEQAPTVFLAMGIAFASEDSSLLNFAMKEQTEFFAPSRNPLYAAGTHHQGAQYMHTRYTQEALQAFILQCIGQNPYDLAIGLLSYRGVYLKIPQKKDMDGMPEGDTHNNIYMGRQGYFLSATLSSDPYLQDVSRKYLPLQTDQAVRLFLYHNPFLPSEPVEQLPLSRFFPSPSGVMIARTGWDFDTVGYHSDVMVVQMNMKEYNSRNHDHSDAGHFSIYYKGHLALDAGIYQGKDPENGWGKKNFINYYIRTVAHNSLLILDPQEPVFRMSGNRICEKPDGGQFTRKADAWRHSDEMFAAGKVADVLAYDIADGKRPAYTYLKGDMTEAYRVPLFIDSEYPSKVDKVRRSFVFLNHQGKGDVPGTLIVLDKVVARDASFRKSWLLHSQNEPLCEGNRILIENKNDGRNGRLYTNILLPEAENRIIDKIGGPGKEYWVNGKNWGSVTQEDAGCWRIEVGFRKAARADNYLNVLQATDASGKKVPHEVSKSYSIDNRFVIVEIADRLVVQSLDLEKQDDRISFEKGDPKKDYHVLVADLVPGKWVVNSPGGRFLLDVEENSGLASFYTKGGIMTLSRLD